MIALDCKIFSEIGSGCGSWGRDAYNFLLFPSICGYIFLFAKKIAVVDAVLVYHARACVVPCRRPGLAAFFGDPHSVVLKGIVVLHVGAGDV